ncbi:XRE family transcriptional regulator [Cryobacterium frigoriphilum]|uniref:XRE family transcriptional regulator n=1 Tax=Cryobacterium frigoriphilum TaxID=1259150 RepID=A0A4R9A1U1_9MICO|nr:helix-turn-helix transcriptional regulator [Cryobacterium frigoriphilum]TFD50535.1 XRE family transcriptional regulator [Cryobacterium frigoriphilum]
MTPGENLLGEYLSAQRARVRPAQVGLPAGRNRRVPGLRRSEVALLADISADYYLRLEQGRDRHPSAQILEALARVYGLDPIGTAYLLSLTEQSPLRRRRRPHRETVPEGISKLLSALQLPAFVEGRYFDVLAANPLATAISPRLRPGENRLLAVFLDPDERALYPDWNDTTARLVAGFRRSVGTDTNDARFIELVGELSLMSDRFRVLWAQQDVQARQSWPVTIAHPLVGELTLNREKLVIGDTTQALVLAIYHPDSGTDSADKLALLASYTVTDSFADQ